MKYLLPQIIFFFQNKSTRRDLITLIKFFAFLVFLICVYSVLFHLLMVLEGRDFSWITGFYWTLTVMSTLGFGDITFETDLGMFFTILVLLSGVFLLLIMLPFTFIQFFYAPWLEAQIKVKTPRKIADDINGHVIITGFDLVTQKLIKSLQDKGIYYVLILEDVHAAADYTDLGYNVVVGDTDDQETYENVRVRDAAMVVVNNDDLMNTNVAFTIREITSQTPIVTNADNDHSIDILEFPGNTHVFQFMKILGRSMANRTLGLHTATKIIGRQESLRIAEIPALLTSITGKKLIDVNIREISGVTVVGIWKKGEFVAPLPEVVIQPNTVLLLAGSEEQLEVFDQTFSVPHQFQESEIAVLILGGGRVGLAAAEVFDEAGLSHKIVEKRTVRGSNFVQGDAADINVLKKAGIEKARTVLITTHDDAMNIYLTFYCRQLRPDIQIISRAASNKSVNKLHTAGADLVMSYASMATDFITSLLRKDTADIVMEGLNMFTVKVASSLVGKTLIESQIRAETGCSVVAIRLEDGTLHVGPESTTMLEKESELILMGTNDAKKRYFELFG